MKLGEVFWLLSKFGMQNIKNVLQVFGCNAIHFKSDRQPYNFAEHYSTVVILINATTLMHKSTLSTNNFGNNHFGQK